MDTLAELLATKKSLINEITELAYELKSSRANYFDSNVIFLDWNLECSANEFLVYPIDEEMMRYPLLRVINKEKSELINIEDNQEYSAKDIVNMFGAGKIDFKTEELESFSIDSLCRILEKLEVAKVA